MHILSNRVSALNVGESPKPSRLLGNLVEEVEIGLFRACEMHPDIIIGTVRSLWTWLWGRYHVPQNVFLVRVGFGVSRPT